MRVVVTGGSGKGGAWVVRDLREHGHDVLNVDVRHDGSAFGRPMLADLTDLGQTARCAGRRRRGRALCGDPGPGLRPAGDTFRINALSTYNVFAAAEAHGCGGSSGRRARPSSACRSTRRPPSRPSTRRSSRGRSRRYSLSKLVGETMATQFARRTGIAFVGLRISNIMEPDDYAAFPSYWDDPPLRRWNLWGYVDARDVAQAARPALTRRSTAPRSRSSRPRTL